MDPWIYAVHHLPAGANAQYLTGDGALTTVNANATIAEDTLLDRPVLRCSLSNTGDNVSNVATKSFSATTRLAMGVRMLLENHSSSSGGSGNRTIIEFRNASGILLSIVRNRDSGDLNLFGSSVIACLGSWPTDTYTFLEVAVDFHASAGAVVIKRDGVEVYSGDGMQTAFVALGSGCTAINYSVPGSGSSPSVGRYTDFYIKDFPEEGNPFFGPISPRWRPVTAQVANTGWEDDQGGTTDMHEHLQNLSDGYIDATAVGSEVEFELDEVPPEANSIIAQVAITVAEAPEGGAPLVAHDLKRDTTKTEVDGLAVGSTAPRTQARVHLTQPNGGAWSPTAANASTLLIRAA